MPPRHHRNFTNGELALAMELRQCGCSWKVIKAGLGDGIQCAVYRAVKNPTNGHAG